MKLAQERTIAAPPDAVWSALTDPEVLKKCIPGCEEMSGSVEDGFQAKVVQKVGPVKATFNGEVTLSNVRPGEGCTLTGEGKGGAAGFAKGAADVALAPEGNGTHLTYDVDAQVGGKLAQLGGRIIDSFAKKMADQFFTRFQEEVESSNPTSGQPPEPDTGTDAMPEEPAADKVAEKATPTHTHAHQDAAEGEKKGWIKRLFG